MPWRAWSTSRRRRGTSRVPELTYAVDGGNLWNGASRRVGRRRERTIRLLFRVLPLRIPRTTCPTTHITTAPTRERSGGPSARSPRLALTVRRTATGLRACRTRSISIGIADDCVPDESGHLCGSRRCRRKRASRWAQTVRFTSTDLQLSLRGIPTRDGGSVRSVRIRRELPRARPSRSGARTARARPGSAILDFGGPGSRRRSIRARTRRGGADGADRLRRARSQRWKPCRAAVASRTSRASPSSSGHAVVDDAAQRRRVRGGARQRWASGCTLRGAQSGLDHNAVFGFAAPSRRARPSAAAYLRRPIRPRGLSGTPSWSFNAGTGIRRSSIARSRASSLFGSAQRRAAGRRADLRRFVCLADRTGAQPERGPMVARAGAVGGISAPRARVTRVRRPLRRSRSNSSSKSALALHGVPRDRRGRDRVRRGT